MRSLSSSFNSEYPIRHCKRDGPVRSSSPERMLMKSPITVSEWTKSPIRGRNASSVQSENASPEPNTHQRVINHHRWPAMRGGKVSTMAISGSVDFIDRIGRSASLMLQSRGLSPVRRIPLVDGINKGVHKSSIKSAAKPELVIDSDLSITSCQEDKNKTLLATNLSRSVPSHVGSLCRLPSQKKNKVVSSSAIVAPITSISMSSSSSRSYNGTRSQIGSLSVVLNNNIDMRNGIKGADMEDVHQLRLLYNSEVQWCFVNVRAEVALVAQKIKAENILTNMWNATSELLYTVNTRRINVESLKQEIKLQDLFKNQVSCLEDWIALEEEYSTSLSGTIEALIANTLRIPVTGRARADVRAVRNAVSSAIDIMQAMGSSVCYLLSRVEITKHLLSELYAVVAKEKSMLDQCRELLAAIATMQVEDCSLVAEILQNEACHALVEGRYGS
ncbi:hypothetical protein HPP92_021607 [Vanilla planifolia]|uniref:Uncharacterized protein n=1 Tax=Vanilla planifolia TaxID=51239 RepID=A0A835PZ04_VANPL|nr:hypothetical protein HPP92_021943 [Vanilla planifolia]KAG0463131.1 hypothetical protein HPP92_021607 [Vanilla planifolia]